MKRKLRVTLFSSYLLLALSVLVVQRVCAETGSLTLEKEQHWETYGVGGTCIPGGHNLFLKDVDGDGLTELITGGFTYQLVGEKRVAPAAPLKLWNWNGKDLTLEKSYQWNATGNTLISCIYAADANGDGNVEILTGGSFSNGSTYFAQLRVWSWDGDNLVLESSNEFTDTEGASVSSIFVSDLDKDGKSEVITSGTTYNDTHSSAQLRIWHLNANGLVLQKSAEWCAAKEASATSVHASDVNDDGVTEIITAGFDNDLKNSTGQLRLWKWDGMALTMVESQEWRMTDGYMSNVAGNVMGNTASNALDVGDVDGDGKNEVVTAGFTYDGARAVAQVRIWSWSGQSLTVESSREWYVHDINEVKSVSINDIDGDGRQEIVTSGVTATAGAFASDTRAEAAQLRVWGWDGKTLTLKNSEEWVVGEGTCAWNVATDDIDNDGVIEIVTVGCMSVGYMCDPDMRIWSIPQEPTFFPYTLLAAVAAGTVIALAGVFLLVRKNRKQTSPIARALVLI